MKKSPWTGRKLVIATMHQKETVLAPLMEDNFGVFCSVAENLDTDLFGTFSGERQRENSPLQTARLKCLAAMEEAGTDLGLASEGSFGPHPEFGFISINEEHLVLIDKMNNWEITAKKVSTDTNLAVEYIETEDQLLDVAARMRFPSQGLILRVDDDQQKKMVKGITHHVELLRTFHDLRKTSQRVYVETDMRALYNPTRMKVIEKVGIELVSRMNTNCEKCSTPGYGPVSTGSGLPCKGCGLPTASTLYLVRQCSACGHSDQQYYPNGIKFEEPQYCTYCNP
jgi:hypothetical protein